MQLIIKKKVAKKKLEKFLSFIKGDVFQSNAKIYNPPWKYMGLKNFKFYFLMSKKEIIGSLVILNTPYSNHLSFFYIIRNKRNKGLGAKFLKKIFIDKTTKNLKTVHVNKKLRKAIKFYQKNNFFISNKKENTFVKKWVIRCLAFDKMTFKNRYLMIFN